MYYEERLIDGIMHVKFIPNGPFHPMTLRQLSLVYAELKGELIALKTNKED